MLLSLDPPLPPLGDGWDLRELDVDVVAAKFDLYLLQDEREIGSVGRFAYSTDLFDPETVARSRASTGAACSAASPPSPTGAHLRPADAQRRASDDAARELEPDRRARSRAIVASTT